MSIKIKVCGMREKQNIHELIECSPDFIGFIFYTASQRYVGKKVPKEILSLLPSNIKKVGVFVNEDLTKLCGIVEENKLDYVRLHGTESPGYCRKVQEKGIKVIKVFSVDDDFTFTQQKMYRECADYFLFDTGTKNYGGSGEKFSWSIFRNNKVTKPFFLSGGIDLKDAEEIKSLDIPNLFAVDINSKFEIKPGLKNIKKVCEFISQIRK